MIKNAEEIKKVLEHDGVIAYVTEMTFITCWHTWMSYRKKASSW